jgi:hypothetical protein
MRSERSGSMWWLAGLTGAILVLGACGDDDPRITCGTGTSLMDTTCVASAAPDAMPAPAPDGGSDSSPSVTGGTLVVSSLTTEHQPGSSIYTSHPLDVTLGLIGRGMAEQILHVTLGLMEKPAADATAADLANLKSCVVASSEVAVRGDGMEQYARFLGVIPPECLAGAPSRTFNFQVMTDLVPDQSGVDVADKLIVFNQREKDNPMVQGCKLLRADTGDEIPGCALDLVVKPTPGVNIVLSDARPSTSVIVAYPPQPNPDVPAGQIESPHAAFVIHTELQAFGQDDDDPAAGKLPAAITTTYDVRATPDDANVGWMPLVVDPASNPQPITSIMPGENHEFSGEIHISPELRTELMLGGRWFGLERFTIRVCAVVPFEEKGGDVAVAGADGKGDNCRWFPVRLVRATTPPTLSNAYSADKDYGIGFGSKKAIRVDFAAFTHNDLDLAGATSDQDVAMVVDSLWGDFNVFHIWGTAGARVTPANASLDAGITMLGAKLFTQAQDGASIKFRKDINYSKQKCKEYVFAALIVPVEVRFCVSGETGIDLTATLTPDSLAPNVRPYATLGSRVQAGIDGGAFRAFIEGDATILAINGRDEDGAGGKLTLSVLGLDPFAMHIGVDMSAGMSVSTLDASLALVVETLEPDICHKKIFGHKIPYPCADWDQVEYERLAKFEGYSYRQKLLNRKVETDLQ